MLTNVNVPVCEFMHLHEDVVKAVNEKMPEEEFLYDLAELFKVFGDTTRIRILYVLLESEMCVCDIAGLLNMSQSAISHQLRRSIQEETGTKIEVDDTGKVIIAAVDSVGAEQAKTAIRTITQQAELGRIYMGVVRKITDFGALVEIFPGTDGLVHISQLAPERVRKVTDVVREGDSFPVKVIGIDPQGKIKLSRKDAIGQTPDE